MTDWGKFVVIVPIYLDKAVTNISSKSLKPPRKTMKKNKVAELKNDSRLMRFLSIVFTITIILVLIDGWIGRYDSGLTPERGAGYWYGIIGGSMMLWLILYPAIKRQGIFRFLGKPKFWYPLHVVFGVLGPVFVLFHANFAFGSPNSRNALIATLVVAISGIIGRYLHQNIYSVLTDHQNARDKYREKLEKQREIMLEKFGLEHGYVEKIKKFDAYIYSKQGFWQHLLAIPKVAITSRQLKRLLTHVLKQQLYKSAELRNMPAKQKRAVYKKFKNEIHNYYYSVRKYFSSTVYERLFSIWSFFHFPMFLVLIFLSILHVIIVHMY